MKNITIEPNPESSGLYITRRSPVTRQDNRRLINCTQEQIDAWRGGKLIQDVMPQVSAEDREFLISGCTPEDWKKLFPPEEDEIGEADEDEEGIEDEG